MTSEERHIAVLLHTSQVQELAWGHLQPASSLSPGGLLPGAFQPLG
jgi:hypothetical protein